MNLKYTYIAVILALVMHSIIFFIDADISEKLLNFLENVEKYEVDELIFCVFLIMIGFMADLIFVKIEKQHQMRISQQRLQVLKATMRTVQDIVNNSLNNLQLVQMKAEETGAIDEETLKLMKSVIRDTAVKLKELGDLDDTPEKKSSSGVTLIDYVRPKNNHSPKRSGSSHNNSTDPSARGE